MPQHKTKTEGTHKMGKSGHGHMMSTAEMRKMMKKKKNGK